MPLIAIILGVGIILLGTFFLVTKNTPENEVLTTDTLETNRDDETQNNEPIVQEAEISEDDVAATEIATSSERSYSSDAGYITPARTNHNIDVTLTIDASNTVTAVSVLYDKKENGFSNPNQERFNGVYKTEVVGKKLEDISLSRVGGASLTSGAFNEAVAKIISEVNS